MIAPERRPIVTHLSVLLFGILLFAGAGAIAAGGRATSGQKNVVVPVTPALCNNMKVHHVLNPGAPVECGRLSLVKFSYIDFSGHAHEDGEIMVMDATAEHVLQVFATLLEMRFPIAKARLMDHYDGNDDASMADNNTSSFNVRKIVGGSSISLHAYGLAIDINPIQNPYAKRSGATLTFSPKSGASYANRFNDRPGKAARSGMAEAVIEVFADNGFLIWGGYWDDPIDYQHFQVSQKLAKQLAQLSPDQAKSVFEAHVARYRTCRRTPTEGSEASRSKCVMANDAD
jgi:hypothetical protein